MIDHAAYADTDAYMADLGNFTVRISHSTWAPTSSISANSGDMEGDIMKCKEGADCNDPTSWISIKKMPKTGGADQLLMRDILYAATPTSMVGAKGPGLDLDLQSDACPRKCENKPSTYRFMGLVIRASVVYDNTGTLIEGSSPSNIKYHYKFYVKPKTIFHVQVVQKGSNIHKRTIHHLYGPRVVFDAGGKLGQFQLNQLIIQLTTSLAMFALATTIVDFLMLYVLPNRVRYEAYKYQEENEEEKKGAATATTVAQPAQAEEPADQPLDGPEFPPGMKARESMGPPPGMTPRPDQKLPPEQQPLLPTAEENAAGVGQSDPTSGGTYGTSKNTKSTNRCADRCWPGRMHKGAEDQV